ncbi:MAG: flagellar biosynthesis anti-sigma factor FlgM [Planctomycetales bacterium]|jgi:negative regulator of flagellin synthesis FlgM|nr:flagellar biosynthesis anti-sigma factor FlgM [Planctomycetales bacterium]MBN8628406.1 flagellar biosynthesis anti-sigma factor FlgM [Planctomycetota bacterium]
MQIYGAGGVYGVQGTSGAQNSRRSEAPQAASLQPQDELQLSSTSAAGYVDQVNQVPDIRQDRVAAIRAAIADGTYETADKMDKALSALLDEIA